MSKDPRRKERQRLKREKRKAAQRRTLSVSPYKRVGQVGQVEACYINADWRQSGIATIQVIPQNPAGGHAVAGFLVDTWCAGLKDAYGNLALDRDDIERNLQRAREGFGLVRIDLELARRLVAGGIRFARQNGFRLPAHSERRTNLLGGLEQVEADLSQFDKDGKLVWVGPTHDLARRLIGCTAEQFLQRPDVEIIAEVAGATDDGADYEWEDDFGDEDDEQEDESEISDESIDKYRELLEVAQAELAVRRFEDGLRVLLAGSLVSGQQDAKLSTLDSDGLARRMAVIETLETIPGMAGDSIPDDLRAAREQARPLIEESMRREPFLDAVDGVDVPDLSQLRM